MSTLRSQSRWCPLEQKLLQKRNSRENWDRFIPNCSAMDFDYAFYMLTHQGSSTRKGKENPPRYGEGYRKLLAEAMNMNRSRILAFKNKTPPRVELFPSNFSSHKHTESNPPKARRRYISQSADRTLDAPDLMDDYYLNLLDWGSSNVLAIALANTVYLWDATDDSTWELATFEDERGPVTSVNWAIDGRQIAIGLNNSEVELWDTTASSHVITLRGCHRSRVGSLAWNNHILTTGGEWMAASLTMISYSRTQWLHRLQDHTAAVKALAWCPFQRNLLASGGGGNDDRCIKFWNIHTGACLNSVDTGSQVCALLWNMNERELLSAHGFTQNQLTLWKYPSMFRIAELTGHTSTLLSMAQSPNGCTVASAAHETLKLWNVFGDPKEVKPAPKADPEPFAHLNQCAFYKNEEDDSSRV
ncbi:hypothetical protein ACE6H2_002010 [Prunus campanulata]